MHSLLRPSWYWKWGVLYWLSTFKNFSLELDQIVSCMDMISSRRNGQLNLSTLAVQAMSRKPKGRLHIGLQSY
ncbi:hypothetical protein IFM89_016766 [Coptis chinensis]|uniref:Uncharacterized protein n=1 Tax=Coptis chinensis TaxID=261450 RepID=A0A835LI90_9MAGN|nr:hypothetical protein IFM89_016766 [Coptis chinensis]